MTGIRLEKQNNIDMYLFLEKGMRGCVSYIPKRYAKSDEDTEIVYWMGHDSRFTCRFLREKEINSFDLNSISSNSQTGYFLKVELEYCKELHDSFNDYLLCPEKNEVSSDILSKYCSEIADWYGIKVGGVKKLIPNLCDNVKDVVHSRNLEYYLSLRMKLVKIHRILSFKQSNWLKKYADFNTKKKESPDEFSKGLYKLLNNCIYGKSIENQRKRINVKMINDKKRYQRCVNKPNFISSKIFDRGSVATHCSKTVLTLNKPICVGFCILELNKLLIYQFHYDYVLKTFDDIKLLFTDTDSLVYKIKGGNVYEQCFKDKHLFDFSGYYKDSVCYDDSNKKVLGKMKDEFNGAKIDECVGLKSKRYSLIACNDKEVNKAKGVILKLEQKVYVAILFNKKVIRHKMKRIQSKLHDIGTYDKNKISSTCFDDKRYVLDDGVNTLVYFHKDIDINQEY